MFVNSKTQCKRNAYLISFLWHGRTVNSRVRVPLVLKVWNLYPRLVKSHKSLQTVRRRFNLYGNSCISLALCRKEEMADK